MRALAGALMLAFAAAAASAQGGVDFSASVDRAQVQVGSIIVLTLKVSSASQLAANPTMPDFGGLQLVDGPVQENQFTSINGVNTVSAGFRWRLRAPRQGTFTIGASQIDVNGQIYQSKPIAITVTMQPPPALPEDLKNETILPARSDNDDLNKQLDGRLFLRTIVSNKSPYVSEPVLITYFLYVDRVPIRGVQFGDDVHVSGGLIDTRYTAKDGVQPNNEVHGGRQYQVIPIMEYALTPSQAGDMTVDSFVATAQIPVQNRSNTRDPRSAFDDPFFGNPFRNNMVEVEIPSAPIKLTVRGLPVDGQPNNFSGTVGSYTLKSSVDRTRMRQDQQLTMVLVLEGKGSIELASRPELPPNDDFEFVDSTDKILEPKPKEYVGGAKRYELSLRPKKFGKLAIPPIEYVVFDPKEESYRVLATEPIQVHVEAAPGSAATAEPVAPSDSKLIEQTAKTPLLNVAQPVGEIRHGRLDSQMESPLMWLAIIAGSILLLAMSIRDMRRSRLDSAAVRREGAWRAFEKRLRAIKAHAGNGRENEAVSAFEQAVRNLIADHFNLSAEGLTRAEIAQRLAEMNLTREQIDKLLQRLDACAWSNYAPGAQPVDVRAWSDETRAMLREGLRV